jgi:hypothetical protein
MRAHLAFEAVSCLLSWRHRVHMLGLLPDHQARTAGHCSCPFNPWQSACLMCVCSWRGFAFVDFLSKQEARSAADAVAGTHLYGRRLVSCSSSLCILLMSLVCSTLTPAAVNLSVACRKAGSVQVAARAFCSLGNSCILVYMSPPGRGHSSH